MATYERPGGTAKNRVTIYNPAADVLAGIQYVEKKFVDRKEKVNKFQQEAEQRKIDLQNLVDDTKRMDQYDPLNEMTEQFSNMVTDIYKADIASFDGDRTEYLRKSSDAKRILGDFHGVMGGVTAITDKYNSMNPEEQKKMILRSQFVGDNAEKKESYRKFLNDPSKMGIRIQGRDLVITNEGKDLFNGTEFLNLLKEGGNLVEYANDYTEQIDAGSADAKKGLQSLVVARQYDKLAEDGSKLTDVQYNDYRKAVEAYKNNLINSDKIDAVINESTFQRYVTSDETYDDAKHGAATKDAIIEQLVAKEFPMYNKLTGSAVGDKSVKSKTQEPSTKSPGKIYTLDTKEQIATLDNDYKRLINSFNTDPEKTFGNIDNPKFVAEILNETSSDKISYVTYNDIISDDPSFKGKIPENKIYIRKENGEKYEFITKNPISIGENELFNLVSIKADDSGYRKVAKEHFRNKYEKQSSNNKPNNNDPTSTKKVSTNDAVESQNQEDKISKVEKSNYYKGLKKDDQSMVKDILKGKIKFYTEKQIASVQGILKKLYGDDFLENKRKNKL